VPQTTPADTRPAISLPTAAALFVALAGPSVFVIVSDAIFGEFPRLAIQIALQVLYCGLPAFVLWVVIRHERLPLGSIGLRRPGWSTFVWGIALWAALYLLPLVTTPLTNALGAPGLEEGVQRLAAIPVWFRLAVGVTGGVIEELLYRGYAVERLATITGRRWLGGAISAVVFGLAHIPTWGLGFALGADLPFGIVMTAFYLWRRDLLANMLAHSAGVGVAMVTLSP
jgi:membrane protease YdiL (CAAX protease family)